MTSTLTAPLDRLKINLAEHQRASDFNLKDFKQDEGEYFRTGWIVFESTKTN